MKKLYALIFLIFLACGFCYAQFKISAETGYFESNTKEILWTKQGDDAQIISLLDWNTYAAPVVSLKAQYKQNDTFCFGINGFYTIPFSYGIMEDSDYMNLLTTGGTERTHYSKHTNKLDNYWGIEAFCSAGGNITQKLELTALFSLGYSYFCFTAHNGYKQYPDQPKTPMQGQIITLESWKLYFGIGTGINYYATDKLNLGLQLKLKPSLINQVLDTHYRRNYKYSYFELPGELAFESELLLEYKLNNSNAVTAGLNFFASSVKNGNLYQSKNKKQWERFTNQTGIKQTAWKLFLGYTYIYEQ